MPMHPGRVDALYSEESHIVGIRRKIVEYYADFPTGCGGSFGELLCYEIHQGGLTFKDLAEKWGLSLATLGELIWDHCKRLEAEPHIAIAGPRFTGHHHTLDGD